MAYVTRRRVISSVVALALVVGPGALPRASAHAQPPVGAATVALSSSFSPGVPAGALETGVVPADQKIRLEVTLRVPDPTALGAFIRQLSARSSANFHRFLRPGQFATEFGPSASVVRTVENALREDGLETISVATDHLSITARASAATIEAAFHISLVRYQLPGGRSAYANSSPPLVPRMVAPYVQAVVGLNDLFLPRSLVVHTSSGAQPHRTADPDTRAGPPGQTRKVLDRQAAVGPRACGAAASAAATYGSLTAGNLASYYSIPPLYRLGDYGAGVHIALLELEPDLPSDIAAYQACYGTAAQVNYEEIDSGVGSGAGGGEATLDIEDLIGLAPRATIDVYQAPNQDYYDDYSAVINDDRDSILSTSWGICQANADQGTIDSEQDLFEEASAQGQTVFAAAGDNGSTDCPRSAALAVDDPAGQPYVVGVGGTSVGPTSENVWNDSLFSDGATGGGISTQCMPSYQDQKNLEGLIGPDSMKTSEIGCATGLKREVPDVSADADPETGYTIYYTGDAPGLVDGWGPIGGTSAAAPLWAAVAALIDSSPFCTDYGSGHPGVMPEGLYALAADSFYNYGFYDVEHGNNDYTPSGYGGGLYPATSGYDLASGIGTPLMTTVSGAGQPSLFYPGLAALQCWEYRTKLETAHITSISPASGPSAASKRITITGSGFLPLSGTDQIALGGALIPASCPTSTRCTAELPPSAAGTANVRVLVEDLEISAVDAADRFTSEAAPTITALLPASGPRKGGNRIRIDGLNLGPTVHVSFGSRRGRSIRHISAREITVIVPAGRGIVDVTVTTSDGATNARTAKDRYRY